MHNRKCTIKNVQQKCTKKYPIKNTQQKKNGTGLGLSIVNKIINDHKGELEFIPISNGAKNIIDETITSNHWFWENQNHRLKFDKMRITSGISKKMGNFIIGGLIGNRIISAIHMKYLQNLNIPKLKLNLSLLNSKRIILQWNI